MTTRIEHMVQGAACAGLLILVAGCAGPEPRTTPAVSGRAGPDPATESDAPDPKGSGDEAAAKRDSGAGPDDKTVSGDKSASDDGADGVKSQRMLSPAVLVAEANRVLDDWHDAATRGDRNRYLDHFAPDAVFLGTDASERWDLAGFTVYVDQYFKPGKGWAYTSLKRYVVLGPGKDVAWFDEALNPAGRGEQIRGTGVLRREGDTWRITLYSMTYAIPNDIRDGVVTLAKERGFWGP